MKAIGMRFWPIAPDDSENKAVSHNRRMLDRLHLSRAQHLLASVGQ